MILKMREIAPTIIMVALVAFVCTIFFSWGMDVTRTRAQPIVGTIDGRKIPLETFGRLVDYERNRMQQMQEGEIPDEQYRMIPRQVWEREVQQALLSKTFRKMKLGASADEIYAHLRNNPPPGLDTMSDFQTDGVFDTSKYEQLLNNPAIYDNAGWREMELHTGKYTIPLQKLELLLRVAAAPSRSEVAREYRARHTKGVFEYAYVGTEGSDVDSAAIGEEAVARYYHTHRDSFFEGEQVELYYVKLAKTATVADEESYEEELVEIRGRIRDGEATFEEEAAIESDDEGSAQQGGDLGWFGAGTMVPEFEKAAFALPVGQISDPFRTPFGYHLIVVEERRETDDGVEIRARHILRKVVPSIETLDSLREYIDSLLDMADEGMELAAIAQLDTALHLDSSGLLRKGEGVPGIGYLAGLGTFVSTSSAGKVSEHAFGDRTAYYIVQIKRKVKEGVLALDDVRVRITEKLMQKERVSKAREALLSAIAAAGESTGLDSLSAVDSVVVSGVSDTVNANSFVAPLGYANEAFATAFALPLMQRSQPIELSGGVCVVRPLWRASVDSIPWGGPEVVQVQQSLASAQQQRAYLDWYINHKTRANVESNLDEYYAE